MIFPFISLKRSRMYPFLIAVVLVIHLTFLFASLIALTVQIRAHAPSAPHKSWFKIEILPFLTSIRDFTSMSFKYSAASSMLLREFTGQTITQFPQLKHAISSFSRQVQRRAFGTGTSSIFLSREPFIYTANRIAVLLTSMTCKGRRLRRLRCKYKHLSGEWSFRLFPIYGLFVIKSRGDRLLHKKSTSNIHYQLKLSLLQRTFPRKLHSLGTMQHISHSERSTPNQWGFIQ